MLVGLRVRLGRRCLPLALTFAEVLLLLEQVIIVGSGQMMDRLLTGGSVRMILCVLLLALVLLFLLLSIHLLLELPILILSVGLEVRLLLEGKALHAGLHPLSVHFLLVLLQTPRVILLLRILSFCRLLSPCRCLLSSLRLFRINADTRRCPVKIVLSAHALITSKMIVGLHAILLLVLELLSSHLLLPLLLLHSLLLSEVRINSFTIAAATVLRAIETFILLIVKLWPGLSPMTSLKRFGNGSGGLPSIQLELELLYAIGNLVMTVVSSVLLPFSL